MDTTTHWSCTWLTGPDAGTTQPLPVGRHVVGRARTADVRCDDITLAAHHALLDVRPDGALVHTALARATGSSAAGELADGDRMEFGCSTLVFDRAPAAPTTATTTATAPAAIVGGALVRSPRAVPRWEPMDIEPEPTPPDTPQRPGGLLPAMLGLAGAAVIALLLRQPMFVLFGAMGAIVAVGSWGAQLLGARRTRVRRQAEYESALATRAAAIAADRDAFVRFHLARVPTVRSARAAVAPPSADLWARRADHDDAFLVSLGRGDQPWRGTELADLPTMASLGPGHRLAITGPWALAAARAILAQLTVSCGPADLRVVVVTDRPGAWDCVRALPHVVLSDGTAAIVDESRLGAAMELLDTRERAHLLVVTDIATALATRTSPLRRVVGSDRVALLAVLGDDQGVPHLCTAVLATTARPMADWVADTSTSMRPTTVRIAGMGERGAFVHSATLATLHDPEDPLMIDGRLPRDVRLADMLGQLSATDIVARWREAGTDPAPRTPVGVADDGMVDIDLVRDGPHGLLAGTTGSGKSEFLRTLIAGLAVQLSPVQLAIVLVDYKGGATFDALARLPHVVGVVTDLDDDLADRALRSLHAELRRREALLREHAAADLTAVRAIAPEVSLPRLLVVIDEFAALVAEQPDFLHALVGIAQRGRSLGVHLLLATQRPHGVISDDIRANTNLRVALRLQDAGDAVDVVGDRSPAQLPRGVPGRGVLRLGADEHVTFQAAYASGEQLEALVETVREAARMAGLARATAPWLPPLPTELRRQDVTPGAIGICDDPDHQARLPLRWTVADGSVIVAGSAGAGVSSTLRALALQALDDAATHVYVLSARLTDAATGHLAHPRCLTVDAAERERLVRLLHRLRTWRADGMATPHTVLVVDGLDVVRRALDQPETNDEYDALDEVLANPDLTLLIGAERPSAVPSAVVARCPHRWVLHLHDPHEASTLGVASRSVPGPIPGRVFVTPPALTAQIAAPGGRSLHRVRDGDPRAVPPIDVVPALVTGEAVPRAHRADDADLLPIGLDVATGEAFEFEVPDGEHVLVLGGGRTGRSQTLTRLTIAWRQAHPRGRVVALLPRRSRFDRSLADEIAPLDGARDADADVGIDTLYVCDDAELIDDVDGRLAAIAGRRTPGVTIIAAARPGALRHLYGHWTSIVRRSRLGIIATGGEDTDGDLLGTVLPRRIAIPARPGLAWAVAQGSASLVQVAVDDAACAGWLERAK